jgi:DNA modification methylase
MNLKTVTIADLEPHPDNPNTHPTKQINALGESLDEFDQAKNIVIWQGRILAGHGVVKAAIKSARLTLEAHDVSHWSEEKATAFMLADIRLPDMGIYDEAAMAEALREIDEPLDIPGFDEDFLARIGLESEGGGEGGENGGGPIEPRAAEKAQEVWGVKEGDIWQCGLHRVICGDCTERETVEKLMGGEKAILLHADPPYGMGKEKDGIVNDNLYREKLDAFQLQWWDANRPSLEDNGSVYIWGNAENLWRLWYVVGMKDRERLAFRNQIIWYKETGQGMMSDDFRMYAPATEHCLFFMLGEQGFNNNADNYWEGWEPIRQYLKGERDKMGWDNAKCKTLAGHSPKSGCHWFDSSQWMFVTEDVYKSWQQAAKDEAFKRDYDELKRDYDELKRDYDELKRDYDELKRDFYATRAYFNNTHDNMTDVWQYLRVTGEARWGHATPKPVAMIERIIKSSSPKDAIILSPFLGSGTDLIAAHNQSRICYGCEIDPSYTAVILDRFSNHTNIQLELIK